jgi:tetratricopeptide (TPR) repeat protein
MLGEIRLAQGDVTGAAAYFQQSLHVAKEYDIAGDAGLAIFGLAEVDFRTGLELAGLEVTRRRARGNPENLAQILQMYAQLLMAGGDYPAARACLDECLALWRALHIRWRTGGGAAQALLELGELALLQGDLASALTYCEEGLELYQQIGASGSVAQLHLLTGCALLARGDLDGAQAYMRRSLDIYTELGQPIWISMVFAALGRLAEAGGQTERAARLFGAASVPRALRMLAPADYLPYKRDIANAHDRYVGTKYAADWAEGERMSLEQAVEYAMHGLQATP